MSQQSDELDEELSETGDSWLRPLHKGLVRELLQVILQIDAESEEEPEELPLHARQPAAGH